MPTQKSPKQEGKFSAHGSCLEPLEQVVEAKRPATHTHRVNKEIHERPVAHAKGEENAKVAPLLIRLDVQRSQILCPVLVRAVAAPIRSVTIQ